MKALARTLLVVCGTLSMALGVLGMFLPVLPTTPFLLLAAACYARSSKRIYHWLLNNRWFGEYIRNYRQGKGIPLKKKVLAIALLWLAIGYAAWVVVSPWWGKSILFGIAVGVTLHLIKIKTFKPAKSGDRGKQLGSQDGLYSTLMARSCRTKKALHSSQEKSKSMSSSGSRSAS